MTKEKNKIILFFKIILKGIKKELIKQRMGSQILNKNAVFDDSGEYYSVLCCGGVIKCKRCLLIIAIVIIKIFSGKKCLIFTGDNVCSLFF